MEYGLPGPLTLRIKINVPNTLKAPLGAADWVLSWSWLREADDIYYFCGEILTAAESTISFGQLKG